MGRNTNRVIRGGIGEAALQHSKIAPQYDHICYVCRQYRTCERSQKYSVGLYECKNFKVDRLLLFKHPDLKGLTIWDRRKHARTDVLRP